MEPRQLGPNNSLEGAPNPNGDVLRRPHDVENPALDSPENQVERRTEVGHIQAEARQIAMPALPVPIAATPADDSQQSSDDNTQIVAGDVDLIEKEWVDKAKKIIASTKGDPHLREKEVNKLQVEYIKKRYGRIIGEASG